uniref:Uncharacterized protein n=1 Tax=Oryza punctata TaxID=4537 RepID=A0A0E0L407_ORYPU
MVENLKNWRQICVRLQATVKDGTPFEGIHATLLTFVKTAMDMIRILYQENQVIVPYDVRNLPIKLNEWGRRGGRGSFNKPGTQNQGNKEVGGQAHNLGVPSRYSSFVLRDWTFLESQDIIEDLFGMGTLFDDYMMDRLNWTMAQVADAILAKRMAYHPASSPELREKKIRDVPSASDDEKKWPSNLCAKETLKKCHARSNEPDCTSVPMQIATTHADFSHPPPRNFLRLHQRLLPTTARCLPPPPPYRLLLSLPPIPSSLTPPVPPSTAATSVLRLGAASMSPRSRSIGGVVQSPSRRRRSSPSILCGLCHTNTKNFRRPSTDTLGSRLLPLQGRDQAGRQQLFGICRRSLNGHYVRQLSMAKEILVQIIKTATSG